MNIVVLFNLCFFLILVVIWGTQGNWVNRSCKMLFLIKILFNYLESESELEFNLKKFNLKVESE